MKLPRRSVLGAAIGGVTLLRWRGQALAAAAEEPALAHEAQRRAFAAFIDTLLPDDAGSPGAVALRVDQEVLEQALAMPNFARLLEEAVGWLDARAQARGVRRFAGLEEKARLEIVELMATSDPGTGASDFLHGVLHLAHQSYYARPETWPTLGYAGPPQPLGFMDQAEPPT